MTEKKTIRTIGELRAALEPFGEEVEIRFEVQGMHAVFADNLIATKINLEIGDFVMVGLINLD